jgi:hypothetical protein
MKDMFGSGPALQGFIQYPIHPVTRKDGDEIDIIGNNRLIRDYRERSVVTSGSGNGFAVVYGKKPV